MTSPRLLAAVAAATLVAVPAAAAPDPALGTWVNPKGTLAVRTSRCGERLCGTVVRAGARARAKASAAGVPQLVGTQLLRDFRREDEGWSGRIFLPDKGRTVASRIVQPTPDTLRISGCLVGGLLCKTQLWRRAEG